MGSDRDTIQVMAPHGINMDTQVSKNLNFIHLIKACDLHLGDIMLTT